MQLIKFFVRLTESYLAVVSLALFVGLFFSEQVVVLTGFTTLFLQIIFFLSSLKMNVKDILKEAKDVRLVIFFNVFMMLILPAATFVLANIFIPHLAVPLLLLAAMPSGMTTPLLVEVVGGRQSVAFVLMITSSLLAPLTIPLVIGLFANTAVSVSMTEMFLKLLLVIFAPFVLAQIVRLFIPKKLSIPYISTKFISVLLLGLLVAGAVAKQAEVILGNLAQIGVILLVLFIFMALLLVVGYLAAYWRSTTDKLTVAVSLTFMNFTLDIFLASSFFADPNVFLAAVLVIFPWCLLLPPFKFIADRFLKQTQI